MSERALRAATAVAVQHGVRCRRPVVLRDASNLLVRLDPVPVVARIATMPAHVRDGELLGRAGARLRSASSYLPRSCRPCTATRTSARATRYPIASV